jgi:phage-related protein
VYITGTGVFNAPERSVEMVEIAGRNGSFALDKGKFENIEVKYKVGIVDDSEADFADRVSDFRNWLCSKVGYCRLEDEYNPNEYRMGVYSSGVEIDHDLLIAGEAEITFNCKPQRWLTSGETKTTLTSGNAITNPTLFPSKPQLQTYGYGTIDIGGQVIVVENGEIGTILLASSVTGTSSPVIQYLDMANMETGDSFSVSGAKFIIDYTVKSGYETRQTLSITSTTNCSAVSHGTRSGRWVTVTADDVEFVKGTPATLTATVAYSVKVYKSSTGSTATTNVTTTLTIEYNGAKAVYYYASSSTNVIGTSRTQTKTGPDVFGVSTKSVLGNPMYIDLDIGECYNLDSGSAVSVNDAVSMPAELPTLPSGNTTITFDNTFTKVDIIPRWWKV